ncbi:hypothetical protein M8494_07525 [Serratia ureilytica]
MRGGVVFCRFLASVAAPFGINGLITFQRFSGAGLNKEKQVSRFISRCVEFAGVTLFQRALNYASFRKSKIIILLHYRKELPMSLMLSASSMHNTGELLVFLASLLAQRSSGWR